MDGTAQSVIVVDGDDLLRKAMKVELQGSFRTLAAVDAAAALLLANHADDLVAVVSDFDLGDTANGVELLAQIRSHRPEVARVLVTTSSSATKLIGSALSDGTVQALFLKPWGDGDLCRLIEALVS